MDIHKTRAVARLVAGFDSLDADVLKARWERGDDHLYALPMWGTIFEVRDTCDASLISDLLKPMFPAEGSSLKALKDHADHYGIDIDSWDGNEEMEDEDDVEDARQRLLRTWQEGSFDDESFHDAGWQDVGQTGLIGIEGPEGGIYLGINGAGYDFYESHWAPLYDAMGLKWDVGAREEAAMVEACKAVARAYGAICEDATASLSLDVPEDLETAIRACKDAYDV